MSVRKISELPYVNANDDTVKSRLKDSLLEISFADEHQVDDVQASYSFVSKYIKYGEMVESIKNDILGDGSDESKVDFNSIVDFYQTVYMHNSLELTGNFYVNKDVDVDAFQYQTLIRNFTNTIYATTRNILSSPTLDINSNTANIYTYNGDTIIAQFSDNAITFNSPTTINNGLTVTGGTQVEDLKCRNLSCTGTAHFDNVIDGTAMRAHWADLAEGYEADAKYEPGTFVKFGGEKEITVADEDEVNAVVTTRPGFVLNSDGSDKVNIALVGRTPVKVVGPVKKFDRLIMSGIPGVAMAQTSGTYGKVVGRALQAAEADGKISLVEAVVQLQL